MKPWRVAASLVAASIVLGLLLQGAQLWQLSRRDATLDAVLGPACERAVGDSSVSGCQREVRKRLGTSAVTATEDFLSTLAAIAVARNPEMRMDALSYRNRAMNLQIIAPDVDTIYALESKLEQTRRFAVDVESQRPGESGTEGRLRIVGANP